MLKQTLIATLAVATFATAPQAGPDEAILHLMEDSPSMLDFGIFRLERFLNKSGEVQNASVRYVWDSNVIEVSGRYFDGHTISQDEAHQKCEAWFESLRELAGVDPETGTLQPWYNESEFALHFMHIGSVQTEHSESDVGMQELEQKFHIRFVVADVIDDDNVNFRMSCDGKLLGNSFSITSNS